MCLLLKLEIKTKGKIEKLKTNKLAVKLPTSANIWIKYSFDDKIIEGINHGKPVNNFALKYSNKVKKTIIKNKETIKNKPKEKQQNPKNHPAIKVC